MAQVAVMVRVSRSTLFKYGVHLSTTAAQTDQKVAG